MRFPPFRPFGMLVFFSGVVGGWVVGSSSGKKLFAGSSNGAGKTDLLALDIDLFVVAVVTHEQVLLKLGLDRVVVKDVDGGVFDLSVDQDGIKLLANLKVTDHVIELHDTGTTDSGQVEQLGNNQRGLRVAGDRGSAGSAEGLEDRGRVTTSDIGAEADLDVLVQHLADVGHAGLEVEVGVGAVGDTGVLLLHQVELLVLHVDTVGHDGAVVQETVVGVDGGVVDRVREERHGEANFVQVLAQVRLNGQVILGSKLAQLSQQLRVARDGEAGGDDGGDKRRVVAGVDLLDVLDKGAGVSDRGLGGLDQEIG